MNIVKGLLTVFGISAGAYIIYHFYRQKQLFDKTCFKYGGFHINKFGFNEANIDIRMVMKNKMDIDFTIMNQFYDVSINDRFIATIKNKQPQYIKANSSSDIMVNVKFSPKKLLNVAYENVLNILSKDAMLDFKIKGEITIQSSGIMFTSIPVNETFAIKELMSNKGEKKEPC